MLFLSTGAFATGRGEKPEEESAEQILRVGLRKLTTIDPALGANDPEVMFNRLQYDYLVEILPDGTLAPSLATGWTISSDGRVYTLELRDGVTFEDGTSLTADDVAFTFNRLIEVGSSIVGLLGQKKTGEKADGSAILEPTWSVRAADASTVVFTLEEPNADFLYGVASRFALILKNGSEAVNTIADGADPFVNFNGTGPFVLTEYLPDERATFVANENYWLEGAPALDGIQLLFFDDDQSQLDGLRSGALDFIIKVPDDLVDSVRGVDGVVVVQQPTNTHPVIRVRTDDGSIGEDVRIRQAFKYATDRELLNLDVLNGAGTVGNNDPIGPTYGALYNPQDNQEYNPERARELIAAVAADGTGNGFITVVDGEPRIKVPFYVGSTFEYPLVAEFVQQQWAEGGIDVELNVVPENVYYAEGENNWLNTQVGMTAWGTRPTPQEYLSVAYTTGAPFNESRWSNSEIDSLAARAARTSEVEARAKIYDSISEIFLEEGPIIIPYFRPVVGAYVEAVSGLEMHSFPGRTDFRPVTIGQ
jgi:peptide/nickel transport system substrate-binding protein